MGAYDYEIRQALREIARELKIMRRDIEAVRNRLATPGGLTAATTRRGHLIVDAGDDKTFCSACGGFHGVWYGDVDTVLSDNGEVCEYCGAILRGDAEFVSGRETE